MKLDESVSSAGRAPADPPNHAPEAPSVSSGDGNSPAAETQPGYYVRQWPNADQPAPPRDRA